MAANQQALLMVSDGNTVSGPATCVADPYYSCGPTNDPYWANVVLLLHMDADFTDSSATPKTTAAVGNAQISATAPQFGAGAGLFDGTGDYVTATYQAGMEFGTSEFTVEAWIKLDALGRFHGIFGNGTGVGAFDFHVATDNTLRVYGSGGTLNYNGGTALTTGVWYHVALVRSGNTYTRFLNGVAQTASTPASQDFTSTATWKIGGDYLSTAIQGRIDDLRITKGVARYTGNFNIPTVAFPDALETVWDPTDPRTVLSLHAEDATDSSCYQPKTVTLTGSASVSTTEKKFGLAAFSVANAGITLNGVVINDHMDLDFGTGDFTIEMWAYRSANTYTGTLFYYTEAAAFSLVVETTGLVTLNYRSSGGTQASIATGVTFSLTTWQHVVVQRRGTNFEFYLDGVLGNTTAITGGASSTVNSAGDFYLGRTNASSALSWNGYIDEVRITKGVARYTEPFDTATLPNCDSAVAVAPPAIEGTSPLTGMSVTVRQQSIGSQEGFVALQSQAVTVSAWSPFADVTTQSKTVALTGRNITVSRGSLAVPRYPDLSSSNRSYFIITSPTTASLTVTFSPDGTWSAVDGEGATRFSGTWIDTAQTAYDIENISHLYRVLAVNVFVGYAPYYSYPTTPFTLSSDFVFVAQNLIYGTTVNFDFQVTIAPTSANPRYGEAYYYGTHRFNTAIELAG